MAERTPRFPSTVLTGRGAPGKATSTEPELAPSMSWQMGGSDWPGEKVGFSQLGSDYAGDVAC